jgi:hypothetical protein
MHKSQSLFYLTTLEQSSDKINSVTCWIYVLEYRILKFIVFALLNYAHRLPVQNFILTLTKFQRGSKETWRQVQLF